MPFGSKPDSQGRVIDFNAVYQELIAPAVEAADLEVIRADEEAAGGIIHKPMFERLLLCEYAVADLTTANPNVFYELGIRHAKKPFSTTMVFADGAGQLPFDVAPLRGLPYQLGKDGKPSDVKGDKAALAKRLREAREGHTDSPLYQLLDDYPDVAHEKTDVFRKQVEAAAGNRKKLAEARKNKDLAEATEALRGIEKSLGVLEDKEAGVTVDLFLSYRAVKAWNDMIDLVDRMPRPLQRAVMVREQQALALNRAGRGDEAERVLKDLISERGPSSETYGILGRVYKDRWEKAASEGNAFLAEGELSKAVDAYKRGYEADIRDSYPGINAVTLMELKDPPDPERASLLPVVRYAVERRIEAREPDYWDWATLLELAVLQKDEAAARSNLSKALAAIREPWEPETTARNLRLIRETRTRRNEQPAWADKIEDALTKTS
jgi:tetratricopeptide (TPR) repeat protein